MRAERPGRELTVKEAHGVGESSAQRCLFTVEFVTSACGLASPGACAHSRLPPSEQGRGHRPNVLSSDSCRHSCRTGNECSACRRGPGHAWKPGRLKHRGAGETLQPQWVLWSAQGHLTKGTMALRLSQDACGWPGPGAVTPSGLGRPDSTLGRGRWRARRTRHSRASPGAPPRLADRLQLGLRLGFSF